MSATLITARHGTPHHRGALVRSYRPLGAFRFSLAVLVVLQHFQHLLRADQRLIFSRLGLGAVAVAVFFVLSGFVVAEANAVFYAGRPGAFFVNRLIRVAPPYFAALALSIAVHAWLWRLGTLELWDFSLSGSPLAPGLIAGGVLGLIPGFHTRFFGENFEFVPFAWSLRVEMAFYICALLTLAAARAWRLAVPISLAVGLLASFLFLRFGRPGLLSTGPMFLLGVAFCLWLGRPNRRRGVFLAAAAALSLQGFASWIQHGAPFRAWQIVILIVLLAVFGLLAPLKTLASFKTVDRALGDLSYPLYLNHYAVGIALYNFTPGRGPLVFGVAITLALAVSWLMARLVDQRLQRARDRVRRVAL